jgi:hypothetical protein
MFHGRIRIVSPEKVNVKTKNDLSFLLSFESLKNTLLKNLRYNLSLWTKYTFARLKAHQ